MRSSSYCIQYVMCPTICQIECGYPLIRRPATAAGTSASIAIGSACAPLPRRSNRYVASVMTVWRGRAPRPPILTNSRLPTENLNRGEKGLLAYRIPYANHAFRQNLRPQSPSMPQGLDGGNAREPFQMAAWLA